MGFGIEQQSALWGRAPEKSIREVLEVPMLPQSPGRARTKACLPSDPYGQTWPTVTRPHDNQAEDQALVSLGPSVRSAPMCREVSLPADDQTHTARRRYR
ncbi:hypothetical protein BURKHO8Y_210355 [Burkholderia sp. 8Y]|nr:hypothetical protein BURKHO8Y_210355 [Burkholderia sp. 8Y]